MPDNSMLITIPTGTVKLYASLDSNQATYGSLVGLGAYSVLATYTYGQLQQLAGASTGVILTIPTGMVRLYVSTPSTLANYGNLVTLYSTYAGMTGLSYGQLQVLP